VTLATLLAMTGVRAAQRVESIAKIKRLACEQMAELGPAQLSLRAVAREMGVVSSAVYRYFASRDELLTALLIDSYDDFGEHVERADASVRRRDDFLGRWRAITTAMRAWAMANPAGYALLFGTPIPGYAAPPDTIGPAARYTTVMLRLLAEVGESGASHAASSSRLLRTDLRALTSRLNLMVTDAALIVGMAAWATIHGAINLELFGHLTNVIEHTDAWYESIVTATGNQVLGSPAEAVAPGEINRR
jgi:AcrR family transcriptional regulator